MGAERSLDEAVGCSERRLTLFERFVDWFCGVFGL